MLAGQRLAPPPRQLPWCPAGGDDPRPLRSSPGPSPAAPAGTWEASPKGTAWGWLYSRLLSRLKLHHSVLPFRKDKTRNTKGSSVWHCLPLLFFCSLVQHVQYLKDKSCTYWNWSIEFCLSPALLVCCVIHDFAASSVLHKGRFFITCNFQSSAWNSCPIFCLAWSKRDVTSWSIKKCYRAVFPSLPVQRWRTRISNSLWITIIFWAQRETFQCICQRANG